MTTRTTTLDFADGRPFEIFRTGRHQAMSGEIISFTADDLRAMADAYEPALLQAPIVVGHPATDDPAYGWIASLHVDGDRLVAMPAQVNADFADLVRSGAYARVSASFYRPGGAGNPKPDVNYLKHVGFLGGAAPAVKGLKRVEFAVGAADVIEFADWRQASAIRSIGGLLRRLRDWMIGRDGLEAADAVLPEWEVQAVTDRATELAVEPDQAARFAAIDNNEELDMDVLKTRADDLAAREADLARREAAFAEAAAQRRDTEAAGLIADLKAEGRLPSAAEPMAVALFAALGGASVIEFGEGHREPHRLLADLLRALPLPVVTGEIATGPAEFADTGEAWSAAIKAEVERAAARGMTISPAEAAERLKGARK